MVGEREEGSNYPARFLKEVELVVRVSMKRERGVDEGGRTIPQVSRKGLGGVLKRGKRVWYNMRVKVA